MGGQFVHYGVRYPGEVPWDLGSEVRDCYSTTAEMEVIWDVEGLSHSTLRNANHIEMILPLLDAMEVASVPRLFAECSNFAAAIFIVVIDIKEHFK
ncbi:unnamed protein product [Gongylonema pulchrum]|uniref:PPPDE domain-containing protein n=1 Tax=Gongylonema pulchrum TaxID=637853 RepID=A0A183CWZ1_9BILA|nr:unnamed protein product [Gongylonema pulchrum]